MADRCRVHAYDEDLGIGHRLSGTTEHFKKQGPSHSEANRKLPSCVPGARFQDAPVRQEPLCRHPRA